MRLMPTPIRTYALVILLFSGCKDAGSPPAPAEVQLATDLPEGMAETALKLIERSNGIDAIPQPASAHALALATSVPYRNTAKFAVIRCLD